MKNAFVLYFRFFPFLKSYWPMLVFSVLLSLLLSGINILTIPLSRDLFNEIANRNMSHFMNQLLNAFLLWTIRLAVKYGHFYLTSWISQKVVIDIQLSIYRKLQKLSQHFYSEWKLGELLTRLFSDTAAVRKGVMDGIFKLVPETCTFIGILCYLMIMNWELTLYSLVAVPLFVFIISYFSELLKRSTRQIQKTQADITHIAQETLTNIKLVQAYTMEEKEANRFFRDNMRNFRASMTSCRFKATLEPTIALLNFLVILAIVYIGGLQITEGKLTGPELFSYFIGIFMLVEPVQAFSGAFAALQQALVSNDRLKALLDAEVLIRNQKGAKDYQIKGEVALKNVSFRYSKNGATVLKKVSISASEGDVVALVGLSGAGKSTLIHLIPRFYDPTDGVVEIDGHDIKSIRISSLRSQIGIVLQDDILFRGTILENIRYGCKGATIEAVKAAALQANAMEFIEKMPDGLYTKVGDKGRRLSGGQKQRISIARAILKNPKILILDEATSSLDSKSERLVQDALNKLMKNRTTFVIAHRLSTITHADQIVVIRDGEIQEKGKHRQLLQHKGEYYKLYSLQFQKEKNKQ